MGCVAVHEERRAMRLNKTGNDVKEGIKKCLSGVYCNMNCPYAEFGKACQDELQKDTLEYIQHLEDRIVLNGITEGGKKD